MNIRIATMTLRHRKNALFEQERTASLDYDKQRSGGTPSKKSKGEESASKPKKKRDNRKAH
jgi:hypothetical protein